MSGLRTSHRAAWTETGLCVYRADGCLIVEDLNPHVFVRHRLSRREMVRLGWWLILRAIRGEA